MLADVGGYPFAGGTPPTQAVRQASAVRARVALAPKVAAAIDAFQDTCDRRMTKANEANTPREPLFHYTNEKALFSILDSNQFWFTSIYHMDDPEELNFG